ncbi:hypothetical protein [Ruminococcus flavefaciens]|uniref:hypothetical protein n=1 Tax=Ruminococcus flavefaciens TaxID=1265 RepID=UPI0026EB79F7|nr:hypothetical protein [Ruminococcus flavefaciens]
MIVENNVNLGKKVSFHIGGIAKNYYIPENENELIGLVDHLNSDRETYYILSGGSNLLINDKKVFNNIIYMGKACKEYQNYGDGIFYFGSSFRIQEIIHIVNDANYGGFEELIGLPAMLGGIIYMNAGIGRGERELFSISKFIQKVKVLDKISASVRWLSPSECQFGHRCSLFKSNDYVILGAQIRLEPQMKDVSEKRIKDRMEFCKKNFEYGKGCFGTCFLQSDWHILRIVQKLNIGKTIKQADNNTNWLVNTGNGTYKDAMRIVNLTKLLHHLLFKKVECEIIIWK